MFRSIALFCFASGLFAGSGPLPGQVFEFKQVNSNQVKHLLPVHVVVPDHESWNDARPVSEYSTFYDHERFRLELQPKQSGHLYILCRNSQGDIQLLYPQRGDGDNYVARDTMASFPEQGWFRFDDQPGQEELIVLQSATPLPEIEQAIDDDNGVDEQILDKYCSWTRDVMVRRMFLHHEAR